MLYFALIILFNVSFSALVEHDWVLSHMKAAPDCVDRGVIGINGQYQSPTIRAKIGDTVRITVTNLVDGTEIWVHWHGIYQSNPYMDGSAESSCGTRYGTSRTYEFTILATQSPGTYMWHIHNGAIRVSGGGGLFIVDPADGQSEPYADDYSEELHLRLEGNVRYAWSGWSGTMNMIQAPKFFERNILFNEKMEVDCAVESCEATCGDLERFTVQPGTTYRLRIANIGHVATVSLAVHHHKLQVIEADGHPVRKHEVDRIHMQPGQRFSVLLTASEAVDNYWISAQVDLEPTLPGYAIIHYAGSDASGRPDEAELPPPMVPAMGQGTNVFHPSIGGEDAQTFERNLQRLDIEEAAPTAEEVTHVLRIQSSGELAKWDSGEWKVVGSSQPGTFNMFKWNINGNVYKASALPETHRVSYGATNDRPLVFEYDLGDVIEIQWTDYQFDIPGAPINGGCMSHSYHLHGDSYWPVHLALHEDLPESSDDYNMNATATAKRDSVGLWPSFVAYAPTGGFGPTSPDVGNQENACSTAVFRFRARYPGVWPLHCHHTGHTSWGSMQVSIVVNGFDAPAADDLVCGETSEFFTTTNEVAVPVEIQTSCENKDWKMNNLSYIFLSTTIVLMIVSIFLLATNSNQSQPKEEYKSGVVQMSDAGGAIVDVAE